MTCAALLASGVLMGPLAHAAIPGSPTYAAPTGETDASQDATATGCANQINYGTPTNLSRDNADANNNPDGDYSASGNGPCSTAVGNAADAEEGGLALGSQSTATDGLSTALGPNAVADTDGAVAIGAGARADGLAGFAGGRQSSANGPGSVAVGVTANSQAPGAISVGYSATATGRRSVAIGSAKRAESATSTFSQQYDATTNTQASGLRSIAIGPGSRSFVQSGLALGDGASAGTAMNLAGTGAVAIGQGTTATELNALAFGTMAAATDPNAIAIGTNSQTNANRTVVIGTNSVSYGDDAVAIGTNVRADGLSAVAIGGGFGTGVNGNGNITSDRNTSATGVRAVSIGAGSQVAGTDSIGIGTQVGAAQDDSIAIGNNAGITASNAIAIGNGASNAFSNSIALGSNSAAQAVQQTQQATIAGVTYQFAGGSPVGTLSIGSAGNERTITNVAAGRVSATSTDAVNGSQLNATNQAVEAVNGRISGVQTTVNNLGNQVNNLNKNAVQYDTGPNGQADTGSVTFNGQNGTTLKNVADGQVSAGSMQAVNGSQLYQVQQSITNVSNQVRSQKYFAVSANATGARATGQNSTAAGPNSVASGNGSVAMGNGATASSNGGVALGSGSTATRAGLDGGKEAISGHVVNSTAGAVSVGSAGNERQITHVAGGTEATDAANIRQLRAVQSGAVNYDRNADGSVDYSSITLGDGNGPAQLHDVAPGTAGTDAVNVDQLDSFRSDVNGEFGALDHRLGEFHRDAEAGTASAIAVASIPQATEPGKNMIAGGVGTFEGEGGFALGLSSESDDGHWLVKLNGTVDTQGDGGVGGGLGYMW